MHQSPHLWKGSVLAGPGLPHWPNLARGQKCQVGFGVPCRPNLGLTHQCTAGTGEHHSGLKQTRIMTSATNEIGSMSMDRAVDARKFLLSFSLVALD